MAFRKVPKKPPADDRPRCAACHYYDTPEHSADESGYCRRYPITTNKWPTVFAHEWCGEYLMASPTAKASEEHLSIAEAGRRYFGLSVNGSYLAARRGDLPWVRIGKQMRVPVSALRDLQPKE